METNFTKGLDQESAERLRQRMKPAKPPRSIYWGVLKIISEHNITGRGLVLTTDYSGFTFKECPFKIGDTFAHNFVIYEIRNIEMMLGNTKVGLVTREIKKLI